MEPLDMGITVPMAAANTRFNEKRVTNVANVVATRSRAREVSGFAVYALYQELCVFPKPGLVSKVDTGSHTDMTASMFFRSLFSLRHYFASIYQAGSRNATFAELSQLGLRAEEQMMRVTTGVNTHRGAIFGLGILCAAVGKQDAESKSLTLPQIITATWASAIKAADAKAAGTSNGAKACSEYGTGGARGEAASGFPHVFKIALPALRAVRKAGRSESAAAIQAFFSIMASLDDTNLLHRGGSSALSYAKLSANSFLNKGGVFAADWEEQACCVHKSFMQKRLSPGGCADLLAATLFVDRIVRSS